MPRGLLTGDARHAFGVSSARRFTHVRLNIFPDGGVARLHVHGEVVPDPALLEGLTVDLAALENGADIVARSDQFYSSPRNLISPGLSRVMGEGWETRRRRRPGYEWLVVRLAGRGVIRLAEIDTSWFRGNQPESASLQILDAPGPRRVAGRREGVARSAAPGPAAAGYPAPVPGRGRAGHPHPAEHLPGRGRRAAAPARLADRRRPGAAVSRWDETA